jgi:hypothetical protein
LAGYERTGLGGEHELLLLEAVEHELLLLEAVEHFPGEGLSV